MIQTIVTIGVLLLVMGGLFAISLSRKEGRELRKSCGGVGSSCSTSESSKGHSCGCSS